MIKKIKRIIPAEFKIFLRRCLNLFIPGESIEKSKKKWNELAEKNARYYVLTDFGEKITEEEFVKTGEKDYNNLISNDELLKNVLGNFSDKTILEIGCGIGRITEFLAKNFGKVFAIDISEEMIAEGRKRLKQLKNIEFFSNDGKKYPIKDSSIDIVFSYIVFQHMPNRKIIEENFGEIKRVLRDKGIVKVQVRGLPTSRFNWFYGPSFSKKEIGNLMSRVGLKILKTEGEGQRYFWIWLVK